MKKFSGKTTLLAVGILAIAGVGYVTLSGDDSPTTGAEGSIGVSKHQQEKTRYYAELNQREEVKKIEKIAQIAAKFEKAPTEAEKMLDESGWSKAEFDRMVEAIRDNEEQKKVFESAKELALR